MVASETLGPIETNYKKLSMSFTQAGRIHILKGMTSSELAPLSEKELLHLSGMGFFCSYDFRCATNSRH